MAALDAVLLSTFKDGMFGDDGAEIEDTDQIGELLDFDDPAGAVGHTIIVAADRDEAIVADVPFQFEHGVEAISGSVCSSGCSAAKASATIPLLRGKQDEKGASIWMRMSPDS